MAGLATFITEHWQICLVRRCVRTPSVDRVTSALSTPTAPPYPVVGSASIWVLGHVAGSRRTARVLHAGRDAIYLDLEGSCLAVLSARAVQVPCGVGTLLPTLPRPCPNAEVSVADGSIEVAGYEVLVTTIVDTTVPVLSPAQSRWGGLRVAGLLGDRLDDVEDLLPTSALTQLAEGDERAVVRLLGLGPGLTPLGDDVLAGWLATAVASRHPALAAVRRQVALTACERTTLLSATLLGCAARGEGVPAFRSLLGGIATASDPVVEQSLDLLLAAGDTSGAGLALGTLLALNSDALGAAA